ncbi:MAG: LON peptidase substrate-binding domain-containing protein [Planctomycetes bacterium]|nr:LON peptidase substrate-binding domain-containing protein [Planctomycetota bacterium]MBI3847724.1 LON peptidase substrate-binding domain-containing protein [Planctomycetota bacterium]
MSDGVFDLGRFSGRVPLFPLPNVVLFPGSSLPLRVFEPRYRRMLRDALAAERLIGMALLRPGWEANYLGRPPIFDVVSIGRVESSQRLATGSFNIVLAGLFAGRVVSEARENELPYRVARVEPFVDAPVSGADPDRDLLLGAFERFDSVRLGLDRRTALSANVPLGALAYRIAAQSDVEPLGKQRVLEAADAVDRARTLVRLLEERTRALVQLRRRLVIPRDVSSN